MMLLMAVKSLGRRTPLDCAGRWADIHNLRLASAGVVNGSAVGLSPVTFKSKF